MHYTSISLVILKTNIQILNDNLTSRFIRFQYFYIVNNYDEKVHVIKSKILRYYRLRPFLFLCNLNSKRISIDSFLSFSVPGLFMNALTTLAVCSVILFMKGDYKRMKAEKHLNAQKVLSSTNSLANVIDVQTTSP